MPTAEFAVNHPMSVNETNPMAVLLAEHRVTERALNCLERMAERWSGQGSREPFDCPTINEAVYFFRHFVEDWHFRREEAFCAATGVQMDSVEIHSSGGCTFHDHERCTEHLLGIEEAVGIIATASSVNGNPGSRSKESAAALGRFGEHAHAYVDILLKHIENEEDILFPTIARHVTSDRMQAAEAAFRQASLEAPVGGKLDHCLAIVEQLAERFGVASAT